MPVRIDIMDAHKGLGYEIADMSNGLEGKRRVQHEEVLVQVPSSPAYISVVRRAIASVAHRMAFSDQEVSDIELAVGEACNNAVKHGLDGDCQRVRIRCRIEPQNLRIDVTNRYCGCPPRHAIGKKPEPQNYNESGMGVFLMKSLVDSVRFRWGKCSATVSLTKRVQA